MEKQSEKRVIPHKENLDSKEEKKKKNLMNLAENEGKQQTKRSIRND